MKICSNVYERCRRVIAISFTILVPGAIAEDQNVSSISDLHNSVLHRLFTSGDSASLEDPRYAVTLPGLNSAKAKLLFLSIGIPRFSLREPDGTTINDIVGFLEKFQKFHSGDESQLAFAGDQQQAAKILARGRTAYTFALEGTHLLDGDIGQVDRLQAAGVRMIGIAHWFLNDFFIDQSGKPRVNREPRRLDDRSTLSKKGRALIERMIEKKIAIDVSHLRRAAFNEIVELNANRSPLVASHSNARSLCDVPRNLSDDQIRAIAKSGGLIGICLHEPLLVEGEKRATLTNVLDHIAHVRRIAGIDHVAIGSDLEGKIKTPLGLGRVEDLPKIGVGLKKRGYSDGEIEAILWRNALRALPNE